MTGTTSVFMNMRIAMGIPHQAGNELSDANAELNQWLAEADEAVQSSSDMKNPRLCGDALYTRAIIIFAVHSFGFLLITPEARQQKSQFVIDTIIPSLRNAVQLYEIADDIEGVLRAKVLMAEFYDLVGDRKRGHDLAVEARPKIKAFDFKDLSVQVDALIDGQPANRQLETWYLNRHKEDPDATYAFLADESVDRYARTNLTA